VKWFLEKLLRLRHEDMAHEACSHLAQAALSPFMVLLLRLSVLLRGVFLVRMECVLVLAPARVLLLLLLPIVGLVIAQPLRKGCFSFGRHRHHDGWRWTKGESAPRGCICLVGRNARVGQNYCRVHVRFSVMCVMP
jgi:hypothetical protein